jgi:hypothetical protein
MKAALLLLVAAFALVSNAFVIPRDSIDYLNAHPEKLDALKASFNAQRAGTINSAASADSVSVGESAQSAKRGILGTLVRAVAGTSWSWWYEATFQTGISSFNMANLGGRNTARFELFSTNVYAAVDPSRQLMIINDPVAGQLTNANVSVIWFPSPFDGTMTCFINRTAGFLNQQKAHSAVAVIPRIGGYIDFAVAVGRRFINIVIAIDTFFGLTGDFGATFQGSMPFWGMVDPYTKRTIAFGFDQPTVTGQAIPYSGICPTSNTGYVGGTYTFNGQGDKIMSLSAAPANVFQADLSCYTDRDPAKGISPTLYDYDGVVCGRC